MNSWIALAVVLVLLSLWLVPTVQNYIRDNAFDKDYEVPADLNSAGSVWRDGRDPVDPDRYYWKDGKVRLRHS